MALSRRDLLKAAGAVGASALGIERLVAGEAAAIPKRKFGKTGWSVTAFSVGTAELPPNDEEAVRGLNELLDGGVNYVDTAPSYMGSNSERQIGLLMGKRRAEIFLATKTLARDADGAYAEVQQSLGRLQTKHLDCVQVHAINDFGTFDQILAAKGALKGLERAKKEGLIRHIGITGHTDPAVILKALDSYPFATILIPISPLDKHIGDFAPEVIPKARKVGAGIVAMKALKGIERAKGKGFDPVSFIRYAMSMDVDTVVIGLRRPEEVGPNLKVAQNFKPMPPAERAKLEAEMKEFADVGHLWWKRR